MIQYNKRVAFCGAGGSGKTTTLNDVLLEIEDPMVEQLLSVPPTLYSDARSVLKRFGVTDKNQAELLPDRRDELQKAILERRCEQERQATSFLADRSLIDHHAYTKHLCGTRTILNADLLLREGLKNYDKIIFFPINYSWYEQNALNPVKDDGVRSMNITYLNAIQSNILETVNRIWSGHFKNYGVPSDLVTVMPMTDSRIKRAQFVIDILKA